MGWTGGYTAYLGSCRQLARRLTVDLRTLDRALWRWSKDGYPPWQPLQFAQLEAVARRGLKLAVPDVDVQHMEPLYSKVLDRDGNVAAVVADSPDFRHCVAAWPRPRTADDHRVLALGRWVPLHSADEALAAMDGWVGDRDDALASLNHRLARRHFS